MTKLVRIENADTSDYKIVVEVWEKQGENRPDAMVHQEKLTHPTQMAMLTLWKNRYLVVKELEDGDSARV